MKLNVILLSIGVMLCHSLYAQEHEADSAQLESKKNVISLKLGTAGLYGFVNGNYEKIFSLKKIGFFKSHLLRCGMGWYESYGSPGYNAIAGISGLSGLRKVILSLILV